MRIGEAARAAGTTTRALRYYEQQGLLTPGRTSGGYRDYDAAAVRRIRHIRELLGLGFTSQDVRLFIDLLDREVPEKFIRADGTGCPQVVGITRARIAALSERIDRLTYLRDRLAGSITPEP